jgi:hypothetical protein
MNWEELGRNIPEIFKGTSLSSDKRTDTNKSSPNDDDELGDPVRISDGRARHRWAWYSCPCP